MENSQKPLLIYQSSAGSGKTTQIVREYFNLAIPNPRLYSSILAITFTNKAAGEMKNRIVAILREIVNSHKIGDKSYIYVEPLIKKGADEGKIKKGADELLNNILHDYSAFAVSTIDSLMHRIVRSFAFDLKLSSNFSVILDQKELVQQSVDLLLDSLRKNDQLTHFLVQFMRDNMADNRTWHIENSLFSFGMLLQDEEARKYIDKLRNIHLDSFVDIQKKLNAFTSSFENQLQNFAERGLQIIADIPENAFYYGKNGMPGYFKGIRDEKYKKEGLSKLYGNKYVKKFVEEGRFTSSKASASEKDQIENIAGTIIDLYDEIFMYVNTNGEKYTLYNLLKRNLHSMAVLQEIENSLNQLKAEEDYVHISEFNHVIARQIWQNGSVPFIYERIGEKYQHCFIDEFQDTSVLQWHNLLPLVTNGLAIGAENMIVGDGKQSIYRFRSGEVEQFNKLPELYKKESVPDGEAQEQTLKNNAQKFMLEKNYRSSRDIVEFNNEFFGFVKTHTNKIIEDIYEGHNQEAKNARHGCVTIDFVEGTGEDLKEVNLHQVADSVGDCIRMGYRQKDIAVLCRKNYDGMRVARHLSENGYDVISSDSLLLSSSPELHFITAVLKYINNPEDQNARVEIFSFLHRKNKWPGEPVDIHEGFMQVSQTKEYEHDNNVLDKLGFDTERVNERSLFDLVEYIVRHFGLNEQPNPFISFFLNEMRHLTESGQTNLNDFLDWWEDNKTSKSVVVPEGIDAIRVYTIHKAKGLEFPVVIYPFINKNFTLTKSNGWFEIDDEEDLKELPVINVPLRKNLQDTRFATTYEEERQKSLLDEVNVNYVAFTRPIDRLYIISEYPSKKPTNQTIPSLLYEFLKEQGAWREDQSRYVFGSEYTEPERAEELPGQNRYLKDFISNDWQKKLILAPEAPDIWDVEDSSQNRRWGNLVHRALAEIYTSKDISLVVEGFVVKGLLQKEKLNMFQQVLEKVVFHEDMKEFFQPGIKAKNEAPLIDKDGNTLRPDKLIFKPDRLVLIEYKTGRPEDYHLKQINTYRKTLEEMNYRNIESYLLYINDDIELKKV